MLVSPVYKLLVEDGCGGCDEAKKLLADRIASGEVVLVNVETPEGINLVKSGVEEVPFAYVDLPPGSEGCPPQTPCIQACEIKIEGDKARIECPEPHKQPLTSRRFFSSVSPTRPGCSA